MRIGELAARTDVSVRSLRYYEEQGLLTAARNATGQRVYDAEAVERVRLLRRLYGAGLSSSTIARLLPCVDTPSPDVTTATMAVLRDELERVGRQLAELAVTRQQLTYVLDCATAHRDEQVCVPAVA